MKYLVNRATKEHYIQPGMMVPYGPQYDWVEADDEGWIPWSGGECPLPKRARCNWATRGEDRSAAGRVSEEARRLDFDSDAIIAYRPILSETAEKEEHSEHFTTSDQWRPIPSDDDLPKTVTMYTGGGPSVFDRLKSAIAASESVPGIIAEIDAMLPDGYCVAKREAEQPAEDMSDWRNWREGDLVILENPDGPDMARGFMGGDLLTLGESGSGAPRCMRDNGASRAFTASQLRFHSRPAKVAE
jgi:hypothetical protein